MRNTMKKKYSFSYAHPKKETVQNMSPNVERRGFVPSFVISQVCRVSLRLCKKDAQASFFFFLMTVVWCSSPESSRAMFARCANQVTAQKANSNSSMPITQPLLRQS